MQHRHPPIARESPLEPPGQPRILLDQRQRSARRRRAFRQRPQPRPDLDQVIRRRKARVDRRSSAPGSYPRGSSAPGSCSGAGSSSASAARMSESFTFPGGFRLLRPELAEERPHLRQRRALDEISRRRAPQRISRPARDRPGDRASEARQQLDRRARPLAEHEARPDVHPQRADEFRDRLAADRPPAHMHDAGHHHHLQRRQDGKIRQRDRLDPHRRAHRRAGGDDLPGHRQFRLLVGRFPRRLELPLDQFPQRRNVVHQRPAQVFRQLDRQFFDKVVDLHRPPTFPRCKCPSCPSSRPFFRP